MKTSSLLATLSAGFFILTALSCSGGGGGGTGITGNTVSVSSGAITGFGSVKLNGKEYETGNSSIVVDGLPGSQNDLKVGMVVTVDGVLSQTATRTATTITQEDVVEGEVQSIPATNDRIIVLGQTILIDNGTLFDNNIPGQNISGLSLGDLVEVNGFVTGKGLIRATLIEMKTPPASCQIKGIVENHNSGGATFTVGSMTVNYPGADIGDMPSPAGNAWNDLLVEIKGAQCDQATTTLIATKIEPEGINILNADEIEVEGAVTLFTSSASFEVNGVSVVTNGNTIYEGGLPGDLALGVEVEVEGFLSNGVLTAKEVSFRDNVEIEGDAASVTSGSATPNLTISGLIGITVFVDAQTEFKGGISDLSALMPNDHIRIRGRPTGTNTVIASEVEKRSADTKVVLEGTVQAINNPSLTVLGVSINTATIISDSNFKGPNDVPIGRAAFFNTVKVGTLVKAGGDLNAGVVVWDEIEIEGEDS